MRSRDDNVPDEVNYENITDEKWDTSWGVSVNGIPMYNGLSGEIVDPFYPA